MGERMAYGGLPSPDSGCPVSDVYIYYVCDMINIWNIVCIFIHISRMFLPTKISFEQRIW